MSTRATPDRQAWALLIGALFLGGCEPTQMEAGQCIVMVAPIITAIGLALHWLYAWLWRPLEAPPRISWRITGLGLLVLFMLAVIVTASGLERDTDDWLLAIFIIVGSSYLSVYAVALRALVVPRLRRWYSWAPLIPWFIFLPPALVLAFFGSTQDPVGDTLTMFWMLPGLFGYIGVPALMLLYFEAGVRRYLHYKASQPPPPPALPRSVVVRDRSRKKLWSR
jgi:hypothetical protein